jgi:hypothetical protein
MKKNSNYTRTTTIDGGSIFVTQEFLFEKNT